MKALLTFIIGFGIAVISLGGDTNGPYELSPLPTKIYHISGEKFMPRLKQFVTPETKESDQDLLLRYFKDQHIEMQKPAFLDLILKADCLVVHSTAADQEKISHLLSKNSRRF
jgi:hypothetical protein